MTAFTQAIGGNVTSSASQLLQSTVVNTLQGLSAQQIKLLADSLNSETARTALQGLLAGTGAALQGGDFTSAALGASASVVLNNLLETAYSDSSQSLTLDERQARRNLVTSIINASTQALGGDAALANMAATLEMENNSTATITLGGMALVGEPILTGVALAGGGAVAATAGIAGGAVYLIQEDIQNRTDADAILAGDKTLAQVIEDQGPRQGQRVELLVMYQQLPTDKLIAEEWFENDQVPFVTYTPSKHQLEELGKKYLPYGFQAFDPLPTVLLGQPIEERGPTILATPIADPLPTHTGGIPLNVLEPITVMNKSEKGDGLKEAASKLGCGIRVPPPKLPFNSHGQPGFFNGKQYITPDVDAHNVTNGWKIFNRKGKRIGTFDSQLNKVKD